MIRNQQHLVRAFSGNGGVGILLLSSKNDEEDSGLDQSCARFDDDKVSINGVTETTGLCFLDDGVDWAAVRLGGEFGSWFDSVDGVRCGGRLNPNPHLQN